MPPINLLLRSRSPAHISRLIMAVIVDPIKRMAIARSRAKGSIKLFESLESELYPTTAVLTELHMIATSTAIFGIVPSIPFWTVTHAVTNVDSEPPSRSMTIDKSNWLSFNLSKVIAISRRYFCSFTATALAQMRHAEPIVTCHA